MHLARAHVACADAALAAGDDFAGASRHLERAEQLLGPRPADDDLATIRRMQATCATEARRSGRRGGSRRGSACCSPTVFRTSAGTRGGRSPRPGATRPGETRAMPTRPTGKRSSSSPRTAPCASTPPILRSYGRFPPRRGPRARGARRLRAGRGGGGEPPVRSGRRRAVGARRLGLPVEKISRSWYRHSRRRAVELAVRAEGCVPTHRAGVRADSREFCARSGRGEEVFRGRGYSRAVTSISAEPISTEPIVVELRPRGPYSLRLSARHGSDATRIVRDGVVATTLAVNGGELERARAWQRPDGLVCLEAASEEGIDRMRFVLGLDDDHSEFLRRFADDPLIGRATRHLRGLRPLRTATVAHALLRAVAGQLITASRAREIERTVVRAATRRARRPPRRPHRGRARTLLTCRAAEPRARRPPRRHPDPALPRNRARDLQVARHGNRREAARARTRPRSVVGRRRLPRGARPLRARPGTRPRAREARFGALGTPRRGRGDGRSARALRRVGGARERVHAGGIPLRTRRLAE